MTADHPRSVRITADTVEVTLADANVRLELVGNQHPMLLTLPVQNISRRGMFVRSEWFVAKGATFPFALRLENDDQVRGEAVVRWIRNTAGGELQPTGFGIEITTFEGDGENRYLRYLESRLTNLRVADLMSDRILTASPTDTVRRAVLVMRQARVGAIVACDPNGGLLGILTERDVLNLAGEPEAFQDTIATHMTTGVITVSREDSAETAFRKLVSGRFRHLPVVEDGRVIAMVSVRDLLPYWSELMDVQGSRLNREHSRAMGLIVHDLRSPITVIESMMHLMQDRDNGVTDFLSLDGPEVVHDTCEKMLTLIDDLLDVSHITTGAMRLQKRPIDMADLMRQAQARFSVQAARKGLTLVCDAVPNTMPHNADPIRLAQVLDNLVSNAIKFTHTGGQIRIGLEPASNGCRITVADTGQGIRADDIAKLFKEGGKTSTLPTAGERSSGLGLAIVKKIIDAHGGTISVKSDVGQGTTFEVNLAA